MGIYKPCSMYRTIEDHGKIYVVCGYDKSRRKNCKKTRCPHFRPTLLFKFRKYLGKEE